MSSRHRPQAPRISDKERQRRFSRSGCDAIDQGRALQSVDMRQQGRLFAVGPVTVQTIVIADDCFGATFPDDEGLAATPTCLWRAVGKVWSHLSHVTAPYG